MRGELPQQAVLHPLRPPLLPVWPAVQQQVGAHSVQEVFDWLKDLHVWQNRYSYALPQDNLTCQKVALDVHKITFQHQSS